MPPDEPNDEEDLENYSEDNETPISFPNDQADSGNEPDDQQGDKIESTHPATDSGLQPEEIYDEGISGAAEVSEPSTGHTILGYDKPDADNKPERGEKDGYRQAA
jgi:hypothetical protein